MRIAAGDREEPLRAVWAAARGIRVPCRRVVSIAARFRFKVSNGDVGYRNCLECRW